LRFPMMHSLALCERVLAFPQAEPDRHAGHAEGITQRIGQILNVGFGSDSARWLKATKVGGRVDNCVI